MEYSCAHSASPQATVADSGWNVTLKPCWPEYLPLIRRPGLGALPRLSISPAACCVVPPCMRTEAPLKIVVITPNGFSMSGGSGVGPVGVIRPRLQSTVLFTYRVTVLVPVGP